MLDKIRELVKSEAEDEDWKYHITLVAEHAKKLAKVMKADEETAELAALLHDIGRIRHGGGNHEVTGIAEAEKILKENDAPQEVIDEVKHCIESHRGKDIIPRTIIARIIANADAMAHFDTWLFFIYMRAKKGTFEEALSWVGDKVEKDWNRKLTIPLAKDMVEEKYKAIKLLLDANRSYI